MCFTISATTQHVKVAIDDYLKRNKEVQVHFDVDELGDKHLVSGFAHPHLPIVKQGSIELGEWGLIPSFAVTAELVNDMQNKTLNARSDTIFERKSFKESIVNKRCVLIIDGFFEWRHAGGDKFPYYIYPKDESVFYLGCIYTIYTDKTTGEMKDTFSIITTEANTMMQFIHNTKKRMPLILDKDAIASWINIDTPVATLKKLMKPYNEALMQSHSISKDAGYASKDRNNANIKEYVAYDQHTQGNLFD